MRHRLKESIGVKGLLLTIGMCVLLAAPAVDARDWRSSMLLVQAPGQSKKGGPGPGQQRGEHERQQGEQGRRGEQGRLTQEERQGLHRDLDRANREIYRRR